MSNADVIAFALHDLGGAGSYVDVEDLFVRAHEIAPKRFSWRSKPYPNYKTLYQALVDLERAHPTFLIATDDGLGRQLTASGVAWVRERGPFVRLALEMPSQGMSSRRPWMRLLNELTSSPAVQAFMAGERRDVSRYEAAEILLAAPDSPASVWRERLATYRSAAEDAGRPQVQDFLTYLHEIHPEWFEGSGQ